MTGLIWRLACVISAGAVAGAAVADGHGGFELVQRVGGGPVEPVGVPSLYPRD